MLSCWAIVTEGDVEAYLATLLLPPTLSHLCLSPFRFAALGRNTTGREPLRAEYVGEGRLEELSLEPDEHALALIERVCPGIDVARIQVARDDAAWSWSASGPSPDRMRIYFAPVTQSLNESIGRPVGQEAYVSVSRGNVFIGRSVIESYGKAWLRRLGIGGTPIQFVMPTPSGAIEFSAGAIGGELLLDNDATTGDLLRFAGLREALSQVKDFIGATPIAETPSKSGVFEEGVYLSLSHCLADG